MVDMLTGELYDVKICRVDGDDNYKFAFGYVKRHSSPKYKLGDWFATSLIMNIEERPIGLIVTTMNSTYKIDSITEVEIPEAAIRNIRMGTPPDKAVVILKGTFFSKKNPIQTDD